MSDELKKYVYLDKFLKVKLKVQEKFAELDKTISILQDTNFEREVRDAHIDRTLSILGKAMLILILTNIAWLIGFMLLFL